MTSYRILLALTAPMLVAMVLAGCSEERGAASRASCEAPEGTVPLQFEAAGRRLFGFVDSPPSPGPHPAILLIHGSGRTDVTRGRGDFETLRKVFRRAGFASVVWDKAGSGCSGGRYRGLADLYLRADEVLAAKEALETFEGIDKARIGVFAIGEGGWVAPMAAARSDALEFLIVVGAPGRGPIERFAYRVAANLAQDGYSAAEGAELARRVADALELMRSQAPYRDYQAAIEPLAQHPLLAPMSEMGGDLHATQRRYDELRESAVLDLTAEVFLPTISVPVLAIWGERDTLVDWEDGVRVYREAFARGANRNLTIKVFERADHELCVARGSHRETDGPCQLADGYLETITAWLAAHGRGPALSERQSRRVPAEQGAAGDP